MKNDDEALKNVIQQTTDYDKFHYLEANREESHKQIERLKDSMARNPELIIAQPILVNENYDVIDGQHRLAACRALGVPIHYMMVKGLGINEARLMNITHRPWKMIDYARSYASPPTNNRNYQKILQLKEDFGLPLSILTAYVHGSQGKSLNSDFRNGRFVIEDYDAAVARLDKLAEAGKYTDQVGERAFSFAFLKVMGTENYNHKHMLHKLELHGASMLKNYAHIEDYLRVLEDIYNRQLAEQNRIRIW